MKKISLCFLLNFVLVGKVSAHEGHSHGAMPSTSTSLNSLDLASSIQSPLTFSLKTRAGTVDGQFYSLVPGLFSYFGNEQGSMALSYEFQFREYTHSSDQKNRDYENNHRAFINFSKDLVESYRFSVTGEGEQNQAHSTVRAVNNYNSLNVSGSLMKTFNNQSSVSIAYHYGTKNYPNGTYSIPMPHQKRIGEPISPSESTPPSEEVTKYGVEDAEHNLAAGGSLSLGSRTVSLETRYKLNFSNAKTRQFTGQSVKASIDSPLWKRATLFISQEFEFRRYELQKQEIQISEFNLLQEINSKISATGTARYSQVLFLATQNWWEGYAQLQIVF